MQAPNAPDGEQTDSAQTRTRLPMRRARSLLPPAFDPATLPPIESINAASDIRAFLAPGRSGRAHPCGPSPRLGRAIPRSATSSALPRISGTSPEPDGVPGFGSLDLTPELRRMLAELSAMRRRSHARSAECATRAEQIAEKLRRNRRCRRPQSAGAGRSDAAGIDPQVIAQPATMMLQCKMIAAIEHTEAIAAQRRHGGALPK